MPRHLPMLAAALLLAGCQIKPLLAAPSAPYRLAAVKESEGAIAETTSADRKDLAVTLYNESESFIKDVREVRLGEGQATLRWFDVPSQLDAASVNLHALGATLELQEQSFLSALLTPARLLSQYVGREVELRFPAEGNSPARTVKAKLISISEGSVYEIDGKLYLQPAAQVILPGLPEGQASRPALSWALKAPSSGLYRLEAAYLTGGLSWSTDYTLSLPKEEESGEFSAWVSLKNDTEQRFPDCRLTLIAGNLQQATPPPRPYMARASEAGSGDLNAQPFSEYHAYRLEKPVTLEDKQTKQVRFLEKRTLKLRKRYVFDSGLFSYGLKEERHARIELDVANEKDNHLGIPLPAGRVRVYQDDAQGERQLAGEAQIGHTPSGETLHLSVGEAFDVVGVRRQTATKQVEEKVREESYEIVLRNHKARPITVEVKEHPYGDWSVTTSSHPSVRESANALIFQIPVSAEGESRLTYTLQIKG